MNSPSAILRQEIARRGPISFARFMETALYCPESGYYEQRRAIGKRGDFYTSVSVGSLFGELLAAQFTMQNERCKIQKAGRPFHLIEAGAHDGRLAGDILNALRHEQPEFFKTLEYCILEPSPARRAWQEETLAEFRGRVKWFDGWEALEHNSISGAIFSNELLDAFPVHRVSWDAANRQWFEWGVGWNGERFAWERLPAISFADEYLPRLPSELLELLPDGFTTEVCPAAAEWWRMAAQRLRRGALMTIDYGFETLDFFRPERSRGTLRAYYQHRLTANVLDHPGEQDLTTHVNFGELRRAGASEGLESPALMSQGKFLTEAAETVSNTRESHEWTAEKLRQFQTLTHPEHMGRLFSVFLQERKDDRRAPSSTGDCKDSHLREEICP